MESIPNIQDTITHSNPSEQIEFEKAIRKLSEGAKSRGLNLGLHHFFIALEIDTDYWKSQIDSRPIEENKRETRFTTKTFDLSTLKNRGATHEEIVTKYIEHMDSSSFALIIKTAWGNRIDEEYFMHVLSEMNIICNEGEPILLSEVLTTKTLDQLSNMKIPEHVLAHISISIGFYMRSYFKKYGKSSIQRAIANVEDAFGLYKVPVNYLSKLIVTVAVATEESFVYGHLASEVEKVEDIDIIIKYIESSDEDAYTIFSRIKNFVLRQAEAGSMEIVFLIFRLCADKKLDLLDTNLFLNAMKRILAVQENSENDINITKCYIRELSNILSTKEYLEEAIDKIAFSTDPLHKTKEILIQLCELAQKVDNKNFIRTLKIVLIERMNNWGSKNNSLTSQLGAVMLAENDLYEILSIKFMDDYGNQIPFWDVYGWDALILYFEVYWESIDVVKILEVFYRMREPHTSEKAEILHFVRLMIKKYLRSRQFHKLASIINCEYYNKDWESFILIDIGTTYTKPLKKQ